MPARRCSPRRALYLCVLSQDYRLDNAMVAMPLTPWGFRIAISDHPNTNHSIRSNRYISSRMRRQPRGHVANLLYSRNALPQPGELVLSG